MANTVENVQINFRVNSAALTGISRKIKGIQKTVGGLGKSLSMGLSLPIAALGVGVAKVAIGFQESMSKVRAITGATKDAMGKLNDKAIEMGKKTRYSAAESAGAMRFMAQAGWKTTEVLAGLDGVMNLAAASGEDLGSVSNIVTSSLSAFKMEASEAGHFADVLAAATSGAQTTVAGLGESFKYVAPVAGALGYTVEDTSFALSLMANQAIEGSAAGTALRSIMTNLVKPTKESARAMKTLGLEILDSKGNMKPMKQVIDEMKVGFAKLTPEQKAATAASLGGKRAMAGLLALVDSSPEKYKRLADAMSNTKDKAKDMAKIMEDNVAGMIRKLKASVEGVAIKFGNVLLPIINKVIEGGLIPLMGVFDRLSPVIKIIITAIAGFAMALGPVLAIVATGIGAIGGLVAAIGAIGTVLPVIGIITAIGIVLGVVAGALTLVIAKMGIFKDAIASIKAVMSGKFENMFILLHKNFGMAAGKADLLARRFEDIADKARIVWKVIQDNLSPIFQGLNKIIGDLMSGGMADLNSGTKASSDAFSGMVQGIIKWGGQLFDYLYKLMDTFGLIPVKMKFTNNKIAGQYVELKAKTDKSFSDIINSQMQFNGTMSKEKLKAYDKMLADAKIANGKELKLITDQIEKKKNKQIKGITDLFKHSNVFTEKQEKDKLAQTEAYYNKESEGLKANYARVEKIRANARKQNRMFTSQEFKELAGLREEAGKKEMEYISTNIGEIRRIKEEASRLTKELSKKEAIDKIVAVNTANEKEQVALKKNKADRYIVITAMRDDERTITSQAADKLYLEADEDFAKGMTQLKKNSLDTKNEIKAKFGGILTETDLGTTQIKTATDNILEMMQQIWKDGKPKILKIVAEIMKDIKQWITDNKPKIKAAAKEVGKAMMQGMIEGIGSLMGSLAAKVAAAMTLSARAKSAATQPKSTGRPTGRSSGRLSGRDYATGTKYSSNEWSMVGERGKELVKLPRGSQVMTNQKTESAMTSSSKGSSKSSMDINVSGNIHITTPTGSEKLDSRVVEKIVAEAITTQMSRYGK